MSKGIKQCQIVISRSLTSEVKKVSFVVLALIWCVLPMLMSRIIDYVIGRVQDRTAEVFWGRMGGFAALLLYAITVRPMVHFMLPGDFLVVFGGALLVQVVFRQIELRRSNSQSS